MKRSFVPVAAVLLVAAFASQAYAQGNANFVLGRRFLQDEAFWSPYAVQEFLGANVDFKVSWSPVQLEAGFQASEKTRDTSFGEETVEVFEAFFGVNRTWDLKGGKMHPFVGGGVSLPWTRFYSSRTTFFDDRTAGLYARGGIFWDLGRRLNIGFDGRAITGTHVKVFNHVANVNYDQIGFLLGWRWPAGK